MTAKSAEILLNSLSHGVIKFFLLIASLTSLPLAPGHAQTFTDQADEQQVETRLEKLRQDIQQLQKDLSRAQKNKSSLEQQLRYTVTSIGKINALLRALNIKITRQNREITQLSQQSKTLESKLGQHKDQLAKQVNATYIAGKQPYLKLLLNQQNPEKLTRTLAYFDYYNRARLDQMQNLQAQLQQLQQIRQQLQDKNQQLAQSQQEKQIEKQQLLGHQQQRSQLLAKMQNDIRSKNQQLQRLREDEQQLEDLVKQLQTQMPEQILDQRQFSELKGQLSWPIQGRLLARFGSKRNLGQLKWQGVLLSGKPGDKVRAVSRGRVAFADWLRGFGLLLIIDHGDGYMSLYGHNTSLFKEVGDWVEGNDIIASVGNSGNAGESGLYFEIRYQGRPVNPMAWCKKLAAR
ncbi:murein hydrolase activator EnvC family protein [Kaarinaea lacus]